MHSFPSGRSVAWTLGMSFAGLGLCKAIDTLCFGGTGEFMRSPIGEVIVWALSIAWLLGLLLLLPFWLLRNRPNTNEMERKIRSGEIDPSGMSLFRESVFFANYGHLPKWVYMPFLVVGLFLTGITILIIIGLVVYLLRSL